jgi:hypothetical protein
MNTPRREGNGCLSAGMALGVLMVLAGGAWELLGALGPISTDGAGLERGLPAEPPQWAEPAQEAELAPQAAPIEAPEPVAPPSPEMRVILWPAEVQSSEALPAGTSCVLSAVASRRFAGPQLERVSLDCDDQTLFSGTATGTLTEATLGEGRFVYRAIVDASSTSGRLRVDTSRRTMTLLSTEGGAARFFISDASAPRRGEALHTASVRRGGVLTSTLRRVAVPTSFEGALPASIRAAQRTGCELHGAPAMYTPSRCRLLLRCGDEVIYGAGTSGYIDCQTRDGAITTAVDPNPTDVDTDASVTLDVDGASVDVWDRVDGAVWRARFRLSELGSCTFDGTWEGGARDDEDTRFAFTLTARDGRGTIQWREGEVGEETVSFTSDCAAGTVSMQTEAASSPDLASVSYTLWLGPSGATFAGDWAGDEDAVAGALWARRR